LCSFSFLAGFESGLGQDLKEELKLKDEKSDIGSESERLSFAADTIIEGHRL